MPAGSRKENSDCLATKARGIRGLRSDLGGMVAPGYVVYLGDRRLPLGDEVMSLPLSEL